MGRGEVWYLEAALFSDYEAHANWTQIAWFRNLLSRLVPEPVAAVVSDAGTVELVAHGNENTTWAFLINHGGEQLVPAERAWSRTFTPLPAFPVTLRICDASGREPKSVTAGAKGISWTMKAGAVEIAMAVDEIWRIVRVNWA